MPDLIPLEVLFGNPERTQPRLSPDGIHLAFIAPLDGVLNVFVRPLEGGPEQPITHDTGRGIRAYAWAEDGDHLLYIQDRDGDENWHVYAVSLADRSITDLTPYPGIQANVLDTSREHPDRVLIAMNRREPAFHDVYMIPLAGGDPHLVAENPGDVVEWVADAELHVRAAVAQMPDGGWELRTRVADDVPWQARLRVGPEDDLTAWAFLEDGDGLILSTSHGRNTSGIGRMDLATGDYTLLAARDDVDRAGVLFHPVSRAPQAVEFTRHRAEWEILDPDIRADFEALRQADDGDMSVVSRTDDLSQWIVAFNRDTGSVRYYLYRRDKRSNSFLFSARPDLDAWPLASMTPVDITARDGLVLPCYLTLPVGVEPNGLPLVLDVHGGPWARDSWGYDPDAQWLANRGYASLKVNFRGSTGFGKTFLHAGDREWGGKMLDDLVDAARWATEQGIADRRRIGIMGGSYGGYAVLSALAFQPDVFACGVDIVGPSNILTLLASIPPYWEPVRKTFEARVGHPERDEAFLKERSPLFSVDRITSPLLIAQGANDPRVAQTESEQMVAALRSAGKTVDYMLFPDEGHGFARPENRLAFYAEAERFLARHLGGRATT